jgi:hypothetical protein
MFKTYSYPHNTQALLTDTALRISFSPFLPHLLFSKWPNQSESLWGQINFRGTGQEELTEEIRAAVGWGGRGAC